MNPNDTTPAPKAQTIKWPHWYGYTVVGVALILAIFRAVQGYWMGDVVLYFLFALLFFSVFFAVPILIWRGIMYLIRLPSRRNRA